MSQYADDQVDMPKKPVKTSKNHIPEEEPVEEGFFGTRDERFQEIYSRYNNKVYNYLVKCIANREDATDLLQEVFLLFYDRLPRLDTSSTRIEAWLLRVARNLALSYSRTKSKKATQSLVNNEPVSRSNSEELLDKKELQKKLSGFLDNLTEKERSIFILHKFEGVKYKDLMKIFDISHRTLKRLIRSVILKLKDENLFEEEDEEE